MNGVDTLEIEESRVTSSNTFENLVPQVRPIASPPNESYHTFNMSGNSLCTYKGGEKGQKRKALNRCLLMQHRKIKVKRELFSVKQVISSISVFLLERNEKEDCYEQKYLVAGGMIERHFH